MEEEKKKKYDLVVFESSTSFLQFCHGDNSCCGLCAVRAFHYY